MAHHPEPACVLVLAMPGTSLRLLVFREEDGLTVGFEGFQWHTHGDLLAGEGETDEEAMGNFLQEILFGKRPIVIERKGDQIREVSIDLPFDSPNYSDPADNPYLEAGESIEVRRWIS